MATYITVEQKAAQQLLEANRKQTAVNRLGLEQRITQVIGLPPAPAQINPSRRSRFAGEQLAATRRRIGIGFGFIDVTGALTYDGNDAYFAEQYRINLTRSILGYRVIRIVVAAPSRSCVGPTAEVEPFFAGKTAELAKFLRSGGVLWINNEFSGCGITAVTFNQYLATAFGASIGFGDDYIYEPEREFFGPFDYGVIRSQLVLTAQQNTAPPFFYTAAASTVTGGIPYYSNPYGVVCALQRIGRGFLVLCGDSNGTAEFPSYTEGTANFIQGLQVLR